MADLRFGDFEVDAAAELLRRGGETVHLEPRIFHLLVYLLEHRDRLVTKQDLNENVWRGAFVTDNAVDRAVARLRKALGDDVHAPRFIETVPTRGYRFIAPVSVGEERPGLPVPVDAPAPAPPAASASPPTPIAPAIAARANLRRAVRLVILLLCTAPVLGVLLIALRSRDVPAAGNEPAEPDRVVARQITTAEAFEFAPSFSPDGASIAYTANRGKVSSVWVRSLAPGGRERELVETRGARVAAWSPDGRFIAYDSYEGIWLVPASGGTPRQLVSRGGSPEWSPDASAIVYQSGLEGVDINSWPARPPSTLWIATLDGSPPRQLTQQDVPLGGHGQPSFSPDGRRIVFVTSSFGEAGNIWTVAVDGGDLRRVLEDCQCRDAIFSRDGKLIYYDNFVDSQHGLWEIAAAGDRPPRRLYEAPLRFLALAPDGRRLAASRHELDSDLWSIELASTADPLGEPARFTLENVDRYQFPVASPDGLHIAFIVTRAGNIRELWMMPAAGGPAELLAAGVLGGWSAWSNDSRQLFFINGDRLERIDLGTRRVETVFETGLDWQTPAAVAPGGGQIAFSQVDEAGVTNVWTIDASGEKRQITREPHFAGYPTWSPDGRTLAVEVRTGKVGMHVGWVDAAGGEVVVLTEGAEECYTGGWSPDGDKIVFPRRPSEGPTEQWDLWWASKSTGELKRLTERPVHPAREFLRYPTWSAAGDRIFFELAQSTADLWILELPGSP